MTQRHITSDSGETTRGSLVSRFLGRLALAMLIAIAPTQLAAAEAPAPEADSTFGVRNLTFPSGIDELARPTTNWIACDPFGNCIICQWVKCTWY